MLGSIDEDLQLLTAAENLGAELVEKLPGNLSGRTLRVATHWQDEALSYFHSTWVPPRR